MTDSSRVGRTMSQTETQDELSFCPTFNSYSSDGFAEIAVRVANEFAETTATLTLLPEEEDYDEKGDEFEFSVVADGPSEIFYEGQFGPIFPIFNRDPVTGNAVDHHGHEGEQVVESQVGIPLRKLFIQEREERGPPSSSSSEADEMEGVPTGTYCVWRPKKVESSPSMCKKSSSTGSGSGSSSKRWRFLNLLRRSNSEGKDTYVFLAPKHNGGEVKSRKDEPRHHSNSEVVKATKKLVKPRAAQEYPSPSSAHEAFYVQNRAIKQEDKKRSYLPYKKDLVGFFANVNGLTGRSFPPF